MEPGHEILMRIRMSQRYPGARTQLFTLWEVIFYPNETDGNIIDISCPSLTPLKSVDLDSYILVIEMTQMYQHFLTQHL